MTLIMPGLADDASVMHLAASFRVPRRLWRGSSSPSLVAMACDRRLRAIEMVRRILFEAGSEVMLLLRDYAFEGQSVSYFLNTDLGGIAKLTMLRARFLSWRGLPVSGPNRSSTWSSRQSISVSVRSSIWIARTL